MKKYISIAFVLLTYAAFTIFAADLRTTVAYIWEPVFVKNCDRIRNSNGNNDTLTGNDTAYILRYFTPDPACNYFIVSPTWAGGSADTAILQVIVKSYDASKNLLTRYAQDTLAYGTISAQADLVPLNFNASNDNRFYNFGSSYSVLIKSVKTGPAQVVIGPQAATSTKYITLWKAKPITYQKVF
jgi:hypothetical protein